MAIQPFQFKTSIFTGTKRQGSFGQDLAKIITAGMAVGTKAAKLKTSFDEDTSKVATVDYINRRESYKLDNDFNNSNSFRQQEILDNFFNENNEIYEGLMDSHKTAIDTKTLDILDNIDKQRIVESKNAGTNMAKEWLKTVDTNLTISEIKSQSETFKKANPDITTENLLTKYVLNTSAKIQSDIYNGNLESKIQGEPQMSKDEYVKERIGNIYNEIKDPVLLKELDKQLYNVDKAYKEAKKQQNINNVILSGQNLRNAGLNVSEEDAKKQINTSVSQLLNISTQYSLAGDGSNAEKYLNNAINIAAINNAKIKSFENMGDTIMSQDTNVQMYSWKTYEAVKNRYTFPEKVITKMGQLEAIADNFDLDLNTSDGLQSAINVMREPLTDEPSITQAYIEKEEGVFTGFTDEEKFIIRREGNKLVQFLGREKAYEYAIDKLDTLKPSATEDYALTPSISATLELANTKEVPIKLFGGTSQKDFDDAKFAMNGLNQKSFNDDLDDFNVEYNAASNKWTVEAGEKRLLFSNEQMNTFMRTGKRIKETVKNIDKLLGETYQQDEDYTDIYSKSFMKDAQDRQLKQLDEFFTTSTNNYIKNNFSGRVQGMIGQNTESSKEMIKYIKTRVLKKYKDAIQMGILYYQK